MPPTRQVHLGLADVVIEVTNKITGLSHIFTDELEKRVQSGSDLPV